MTLVSSSASEETHDKSVLQTDEVVENSEDIVDDDEFVARR